MNLVLFFQENVVLRYLYRKFAAVVQIIPYYVIIENLFAEDGLSIRPKLDSIDVEFCTPSEIENLAANPEVPDDEKEYIQRYEKGSMCLALKHKGEIAAFTWCNLEYLEFKKIRQKLRENEAYLFDMRTFKTYRGKNLAPYLRYQLYKHLNQKGKSDFYSITAMLNTSSHKFKKKLGAKRDKLYVYICLFGKLYLNIPLKTYHED
ncbi:MAG: GNAT family N-acetyltransferase [Candidatus Aminicenantes bacterium]|nr:GNAT family N-acetyltransferase [Candidatus Aminicenantes bacterium]